MAKGNEIVLSAHPRGLYQEGTIEGALKPGTCVQVKAGTAPVNGRFTYEVYNRVADGDRAQIIVLLPDHMQGKTANDAYVSGDRCFLYTPVAGEELNMLVANIPGTADDHAIGDLMIIGDGTGLLVATTGTPEQEPFRIMETITDPTADQLVWCQYTGA